MEPGIHDDVPNDAYHASPGISKTGLVEFARCPARYRFGERKATKPLAMGSLWHTALLEPDTMELRYYPVTCRMDERTKDYQAARDRAGGRELVKLADYESALRMRDQVMQETVARELITSEAIIERSAAWIDPETGVLCRCRPDLILPRMRVILDVKKTQDCRARAARNAVTDYKYHWAEAFYGDGMLQADGWRPEAFIFLFVEEQPPYLCRPFEIDPGDVEAARQDIAALLPRYRACLETDTWPRMPGDIARLSPLPPYAHHSNT